MLLAGSTEAFGCKELSRTQGPANSLNLITWPQNWARNYGRRGAVRLKERISRARSRSDSRRARHLPKRTRIEGPPWGARSWGAQAVRSRCRGWWARQCCGLAFLRGNGLSAHRSTRMNSSRVANRNLLIVFDPQQITVINPSIAAKRRPCDGTEGARD